MCNRPFVYANHLNCNASFARKILYVFISVRQRSCGKVMFLQLFVCPQGEDIMSLPVWSHVLSGGFCLQRGGGSTSRWRYWPSGIRGLLSHSGIFPRRPVAEGHPPPPWRTLLWAVCILLECILVFIASTFGTPQMHSQALSIEMCSVSLLWTKITYKVYLVQSSRIIIFRQRINFCF